MSVHPAVRVHHIFVRRILGPVDVINALQSAFLCMIICVLFLNVFQYFLIFIINILTIYR